MTILNTVWTLAIWAATFVGVKDCIKYAKSVVIHISTKIAVPIILKDKCITVVRFAFLLVPIDASTAVIQVPIFWPNNT